MIIALEIGVASLHAHSAHNLNWTWHSKAVVRRGGLLRHNQRSALDPLRGYRSWVFLRLKCFCKLLGRLAGFEIAQKPIFFVQNLPLCRFGGTTSRGGLLGFAQVTQKVNCACDIAN